MGEPVLDPSALASSRAAYLAAVKAGNGPTQVVYAVVAAYVASAKFVPDPVDRVSRTSPITRSLAAMKVGDDVIFPETVNASNLTRYFGTARRLLANEKACWSARTLPDRRVRVLRNPDGVTNRDPTRNPLAVKLAALEVGKTVVVKDPGAKARGGSWAGSKLQARRILDDPLAEWTRKTLASGVRITRVPPGFVAPHTGSSNAIMSSIATGIARRVDLTLDDLVGHSRVQHIARCRQEVMWALYEVRTAYGARRWSLPKIGVFLGGRDHTTVLHGVKAHERRRYQGALDLCL